MMRSSDASGNAQGSIEHSVNVTVEKVTLEGILVIPAGSSGIVVFAHGSGSGRFSPRNGFVARTLQEGGVATLLIDLLTEDEAGDRRLVFDIDLLARRLGSIADWLGQNADTRDLKLGYFGASTGAGAALLAAVLYDGRVSAVVSRGGRPDLVLPRLGEVRAPTLLIVGGDDEPVVSMNRQAYDALRTTKKLVIVPGATHLFEEPGALEDVARLASEWFGKYLGRSNTAGP
jgi:putative phosphoribosyl transferase